MYFQMLFLILPCYVVFGVVDAISIEGSPLTTYSPCGSRLLYFIKQSSTQWNAILDLRHQPTADIKIRFVNYIHYSITLNSEYGNKLSMSVTVNQTIKIFAVTEPKQQIFNIKVDNDRMPTVSELTVNDVVICDDIRTPNEQSFDICGTRSRATEELFSVRTDAGIIDWPWFAGICINGVYQRGGSIISATTVITAAHSIHNKPVSAFKIVAGTNVFKDLHHPGRQERQAIKLIVYPDYVYRDYVYDSGDIALIKVNEFNFNVYVRPVCVSGPQYDRNSIVGDTGIIVGAGWGLNNDSNDLDQLRATDTIIRSTSECEKVGNLAGKLIFCAGFGPTSNLNPNKGDNGGGLVIPTVLNGRVTWYLRGIYNACIFLDGHCDVKQYATYVDVAAYYEWIHWHMMFS